MARKLESNPSPRWLFALIDWIERTPLKVWGFAILFYLAAGIAMHVASFIFEGEPVHFNWNLFFPGIYFTILFPFWHWTNLLAKSSLETFGRGVNKTSQQIYSIYVDFISVPKVYAWILTALGFALGIFYAQDFIAQFNFSQPGSIAVILAIAISASILQLLFMVRLVFQLVRLNTLYKDVKEINLFNLRPIYALSRYSYSFAFIGVITVVVFDTFSLMQGERFDLQNHLISAALVIVALVAPTLGISRRLRTEKEKDLQDLGTQLKSIFDETTAAVKGRKLNKITGLSSAAAALERQIEKVHKVGTLPWDPGSLRNLLLPILVPLLIAVLQRYLIGMLGLQ